VVGWSIDNSQTAALVTSALDMAIRNRNRRLGAKLVRIDAPKRVSDLRKLWAQQDLNLRPLGCKPSALPLSYAP
jgi:hypothetical protein